MTDIDLFMINISALSPASEPGSSKQYLETLRSNIILPYRSNSFILFLFQHFLKENEESYKCLNLSQVNVDTSLGQRL